MSIWKAFLFTFLFMAFDAIMYVVFVSPFEIGILSYEFNLYATMQLLSKITFYLLFWFLFLHKYTKLHLTKEIKIDFLSILLLLILSFSLFLFNRLFFDLYDTYIANNTRFIMPDEYKKEFSENPLFLYLLGIIGPLIIAPICEELVFRKYLFSKLLTNNNYIYSLIISSVCFALIHLPNYKNIVPTLFLGLSCAIILYRSEKIIYSIVFHFLYNFHITLNKIFYTDFRM